MKNLLLFLKDFVANKGLLVMSSLFVSKVAMFLTQIVIIRLLPKEVYGSIVYFISILSFFIPIVGAGTYQGLLRFGSVAVSQAEKDAISAYSFRQGAMFQVLVNCGFTIAAVMMSAHYQQLLPILFFLNFRLIGVFLMSLLQSHYRSNQNNKVFATMNIWFNVVSFLLIVCCTYFFSFFGYLFAFAISPFLLVFYLKRALFVGERNLSPEFLTQYWWFNFHAVTALLISDFVLILDILLAEHYLQQNGIADYKALIMLPFNLWILPQVFLQTDFPRLSYNFKNKKYIFNYISNYYKVFLPIAAVILAVSYYWRAEIVPLVFGGQYQGGTLFFILIAAVLFSWFTKTLFANLLSAIGQVKWNTFTGFLSVIVLLFSGSYLIPSYGLKGLVYASCGAIGCASVFSIVIFFVVYSKMAGEEA